MLDRDLTIFEDEVLETSSNDNRSIYNATMSSDIDIDLSPAKTFHGAISYTPSPTVSAQDLDTYTTSHPASLDDYSIPYLQSSDTNWRKQKENTQMSEYRRNLLQIESDRISRIIGRKIDTQKIFAYAL